LAERDRRPAVVSGRLARLGGTIRNTVRGEPFDPILAITESARSAGFPFEGPSGKRTILADCGRIVADES